MKKNIISITAILFLISCNSPNEKNNLHEKQVPKTDSLQIGKSVETKATVNPQNLLSVGDARLILGEPCSVIDVSNSNEGKALNYSCSYEALAKNKKKGKKGSLYFLLEEYTDSLGAKERYTFIKTSNEKNPGVKVLSGYGDEAYFHSDLENFYFIMARKGKNVFNMKVNKITNTTSLEQFKMVAKKIAASI